jgi:nucleotide-binding universal stress UspA family protein
VRLTRVLCPTDLSGASAHAAELAAVVAGYYKARIAALHVVRPIVAVVPGMFPSTEERVQETTAEHRRDETGIRCEAARKAGIPVEVLVDVGQPVGRILDRATTLPADLIVMGTHGTSV